VGDWLQHCDANTDVEQEWDNIKKYATESNRRKLREVNSYTKREILKNVG
jgi:hypothetical protein